MGSTNLKWVSIMRKILFILLSIFLFGCIKAENQIKYGSNQNAGYYADINDVKIYYEIYGQGEPILLLHGGYGNISSQSLLIEYLSKKYQIIAVDTRGHGRSTLNDEEMTYPILANDMVMLFEKLNIGPVTVLGHSDGGIIGFILAAKYPEKVKSLITIGSNFRRDGRGGMSPESNRWISTITPDTVRSWGNTENQYNELNPEADWNRFVYKVKELWQSETELDEIDLQNIQCPVLLTHGDKDSTVKLEDIIYMSELIKKADVYIAPNGKHAHHIEQPVAFQTIVMRFLEKVYSE
ncbi:alpha/beta hydrolase [candidate division KSB1 bacterium]|nr:alpha/beta hydrolase [candidate division KSB1 bacterium]